MSFARALTALVLALLAAPRAAFAWGDHYLVTARALERPELATMDEAVAVEPLEAFLAAEPEKVAALFKDYYDWMAARGSTRFKPQSFDAAQPDLAAFLRAARLNPKTSFPLVQRLLPGQEAPAAFPAIDFALVSPYLRERPPLIARFVDVSGGQVPARAVLSTFADEPDWGMDHELWEIAEYGYGEQPYGKPQGESSKAPFHMQFEHENVIVRNFASHLLEGMMRDRVELFVRLSRLAHETGHPYWGWRFAAWACHYVQDVAQPYHAQAAPSAGMGFYLRYMVSPRKEKLQSNMTQLLANRHFIYEDYVSAALVQSYQGSDDRLARLVGFLATPPASSAPVIATDASGLVTVIAARAAEHARRIDSTVSGAYPKRLTQDLSYDVEKAPDYSVPVAIEQVDPGAAETLIRETGRDFGNAGEATRAIVTLVRSAGG